MDEKTALDPEILNSIKPFNAEEISKPAQLVAEGMALQQVKTSYTTAIAVQKPRTFSRVVANVLEEAALAGSSFYYSWPVKNKKTGQITKIEGPSIDMAMCIARNYGNDAIEIEVTETPTHYIFKGIFVDLETGFTCPRLFRQRKNQSLGMEDSDRAEDIVFQIGQSKAIRNAVLKAMPEWLVAKAIEVAREAELKRLRPENMALARAKIIQFFSGWGVSQEDIEKKLGRKVDSWGPDDIVELRGIATALKEGRVSAKEVFAPETQAEETPAESLTQPKETKPASEKGEDEGIHYAFWKLKETGWRKFLAQLTQEEYESWPKEAQSAFQEKCRRMGTPWPQKKLGEAEIQRPLAEDATPEPQATHEDTHEPPHPSETMEPATRPAPGGPPPSKPAGFNFPSKGNLGSGAAANAYSNIAKRIQTLKGIDAALYEKVCKDLGIWPITEEGLKKVEQEFNTRLDQKISKG